MSSHPQIDPFPPTPPVLEVQCGSIRRYVSMVSKLEHMDIGPEAIGHALTDKSLYVPPNQRDYSWKDEHINDLYDDLTAAIDALAEEYFRGSIVVIKQHDDRLMVVDGQQRLATTLI